MRDAGHVTDVTRERVEDAMRRTPREAFLPASVRGQAGEDAPLPIGEGQTGSAPHMVAIMADALDVRPGQRVLEVGGGSGWHAAVLARLVAPGGAVVSIERHASLAQQARANVARLEEAPTNLEFVVGDGSRGLPERAPFDRISVAAAAPDVPPPLVEQLAPGGVLVLPVGPTADQWLVRVAKGEDGRVRSQALLRVQFVPLVGEFGWPE